LIIEYDEENRENTFKWIKSGITRVYKYNTDMLLTEIRYDDGSVQKYTYDEISTETVKLTEMATQHIKSMMTRAI